MPMRPHTLLITAALTTSVSLTTAFTAAADPAPISKITHINWTTPPTLTRIAGTDRYSTATAISQKYWPNGSSTIYLANGLNRADALAAGPAAAHAEAPLLLTTPNSIPETVLTEIHRLQPTTIYLVGGTKALPERLTQQLRDIPHITRIAGTNRYTTAAALAATIPHPNKVYVASGHDDDWPDAITAGAAAAGEHAPLLLASPAGLPAQSIKYTGSIHLVGNTKRLTPAIHKTIHTNAPTARITHTSSTDNNIYSTNTALISISPTLSKTSTVFFTTGTHWPDAIAGIPAAAKAAAPIALTTSTCMPNSTADLLRAMPLHSAIQLGGINTIDIASFDDRCSW
ncbi:N-acetylmuramoyl-L-alanine amidase LytC precursor [Dermatophilus congolensis]|uniref:N-acetylmuramoyl-L-alanine amidase LytC n=1 Tax=Dermatophilus congolensis TaxID=1863 RepID=A0AA46BLB6_9MICO|nr:cell wall-binding repeat-containing protein [Dermatophilus congolensis]STD03823.1 N-acetylmuramoyl-L-alanine amidase LytC precursor [Dermatophilus congolensis]